MAARDGKSDGRDPSDADLSGRLDRLSRELDAEKQERAAAERPSRSDGSQYGYAFKLASEFVAGILVGAGLGWGLDRLAGTSPWGLIGLLLLGFVAGVANVVRSAGRMPTSASGTGGKGGAPL
ncbi:MAG: AtpZ/AtpI family protein [Pseudomonadota bacterium]|nr:AtpZ/AtpI family protein [Pseudomonadota bacterium]